MTVPIPKQRWNFVVTVPDYDDYDDFGEDEALRVLAHRIETGMRQAFSLPGAPPPEGFAVIARIPDEIDSGPTPRGLMFSWQWPKTYDPTAPISRPETPPR